MDDICRACGGLLLSLMSQFGISTRKKNKPQCIMGQNHGSYPNQFNEIAMSSIPKLLVALAALAFLLAAISVLAHSRILGVTAEGFSRTCTNLTLIAIALSLLFKKTPGAA
jgi:hypothetical protein